MMGPDAFAAGLSSEVSCCSLTGAKLTTALDRNQGTTRGVVFLSLKKASMWLGTSPGHLNKYSLETLETLEAPYFSIDTGSIMIHLGIMKFLAGTTDPPRKKTHNCLKTTESL